MEVQKGLDKILLGKEKDNAERFPVKQVVGFHVEGLASSPAAPTMFPHAIDNGSPTPVIIPPTFLRDTGIHTTKVYDKGVKDAHDKHFGSNIAMTAYRNDTHVTFAPPVAPSIAAVAAASVAASGYVNSSIHGAGSVYHSAVDPSHSKPFMDWVQPGRTQDGYARAESVHSIESTSTLSTASATGLFPIDSTNDTSSIMISSGKAPLTAVNVAAMSSPAATATAANAAGNSILLTPPMIPVVVKTPPPAHKSSAQDRSPIPALSPAVPSPQQSSKTAASSSAAENTETSKAKNREAVNDMSVNNTNVNANGANNDSGNTNNLINSSSASTLTALGVPRGQMAAEGGGGANGGRGGSGGGGGKVPKGSKPPAEQMKGGGQKSQKEMTKAERRALQESQRAAKQAEKEGKGGSGGGGSGGGSSSTNNNSNINNSNSNAGNHNSNAVGGGGFSRGGSQSGGVGSQSGGAYHHYNQQQANQANDASFNINNSSSSGNNNNNNNSALNNDSYDSNAANNNNNNSLSANANALNVLPSSRRKDKQLSKELGRGSVSPLNSTELFAHLPQFRHVTLNTLTSFNAATLKLVHPAILNLGLGYADGSICGATSRVMALLQALSHVVRDYVTPPGRDLSRELPRHVTDLIGFLVQCRPLGSGMGNAIRRLKTRINKIPPGLPEAEAKANILEHLSDYAAQRIIGATKQIVSYATSKVADGDVILTYGASYVVVQALVAAARAGRRFRVIVLDSRPDCEGRGTLRKLLAAGIPCSYGNLNTASYVMKGVSKVFLGAAAVFSNGTVYSRCGTAAVAMVANAHHRPVMICCETFKFHDRVQLDSFTHNELGDPAKLMTVDGPARRGTIYLPQTSSASNSSSSSSFNPSSSSNSGKAGAGEEQGGVGSRLRHLNLKYDVMPAEFVTMIITEFGMIPSTSVPVILRELRQTEEAADESSFLGDDGFDA